MEKYDLLLFFENILSTIFVDCLSESLSAFWFFKKCCVFKKCVLVNVPNIFCLANRIANAPCSVYFRMAIYPLHYNMMHAL